MKVLVAEPQEARKRPRFDDWKGNVLLTIKIYSSILVIWNFNKSALAVV